MVELRIPKKFDYMIQKKFLVFYLLAKTNQKQSGWEETMLASLITFRHIFSQFVTKTFQAVGLFLFSFSPHTFI